MEKNYCLSTSLDWIVKISLISTVCNCKISEISSQSIFNPKIIAFSATTESRRIWSINFYVKFWIKRLKGVFVSIYWLWIKSPKNAIPNVHFCLKKLCRDFEITYIQKIFIWFYHQNMKLSSLKIYVTQYVEQLLTQQLNLWAPS